MSAQKSDGYMPEEMKTKCFELRCRSKRGQYLSEDETEFLRSCWERYPADYASLSTAIFQATRPGLF